MNDDLPQATAGRPPRGCTPPDLAPTWLQAAALLGEAELAEPGADGLLSTFGAQIQDGRRPRLPPGCALA